MKPRFMFRFLFIIMLFMLIPTQYMSFADDNQQQSTFASPILVVNTSFLNIRTGPSASYGILATVSGGTELPVLAVYEDGVWYQVATNVGSGWVNVDFTLARGDFSRVPLVEYGAVSAVTSTSVTPVNVGQGGGVVATTGVTAPSALGLTGVSFTGGDLRSGPGSNAPLVAALVPANDNQVFPIGAVVESEGRPYYQVNFPGYGIVWSDRFETRPLRCGGPSVLVAREIVGTVAVGNSNPIEFSIGDEMFVAGPGRDGLIEIVTADGTRGLVPIDKVSPPNDDVEYFCDGVNPTVGGITTTTTATVNPGQGGGVIVTAPTVSGARLVVNTGNLNIRTGPSASYGILATVPGGTELPVTAVYEDGVWYQVATSAGLGWVNVEFTLARGDFSRVPLVEYGAVSAVTSSGVTPVDVGQGGGIINTSTAAARAIVNTPNLNVRTGPSASFSIVATISGGTELAVLGVADDGVWYLVEGTFGRGWLNNEFVIFRGDFSAVPVLNINP